MSDDKSKSDKKKTKGRHWFVDKDDHPIPERICAAIGGSGVVLILLGLATVWGTGWGKDLFVPGATLVTVALTAWVASRAVLKWTEQRERDRQAAEYKHREEVYEEILIFMLSCITKTGVQYDAGRDAQLRAKAALWGSAATIMALGDWQELLGKVLDAHGNPEGRIGITPEEGSALEDMFSRVLESMRKDLSSSDKNAITRFEIRRSIFNK